MRAVYFTSNRFWKLSSNRSVTTMPSSVGTNLPAILLHVFALLNRGKNGRIRGRTPPLPFASSSFTSVASLKRGGGSVKCCSGSMDLNRRLLAFRHQRQPIFSSSSSGVLGVLAFLVNFQESLEFRYASGGRGTYMWPNPLPFAATSMVV